MAYARGRGVGGHILKRSAFSHTEFAEIAVILKPLILKRSAFFHTEFAEIAVMFSCAI